MRFTTILFDLDHTLLDSDASEALAFEHTLRSIGVEEPAQHLPTYKQINSALWKRVELGELSPNDVKVIRFEQLLEALGIDGDPDAMGATYVRGLGDYGELYPDALGLLDACADAQLGLVTNGIGAVQRRRLERLGLNRYFDGVAISGEIGVAKPDPAIFDHLGFGDLDPDTTVMIGDSLTSDIAAGHNASFATLWFNPNNKPATEPPPTTQAQSLAELFDVMAAM